MSKHYDNWERLVVAVLRRQHDREIALSHSRDSSTVSSRSSSFNSVFYDQLPEAMNYFSRETFPMTDYQETPTMFRPSSTTSCFADHRNGKKCYTVGARDLIISFGNSSRNWKWRFDANSRFPEVAELHSAWRLDVRAKIKAGMLYPWTVYGAYLVFKLADTAEGLKSAKGMIRFVDDESDRDAVTGARVVHLQPVNSVKGESAVERDDGWMEVELGNFYVGERDDGDVEARLLEIRRWKTGLIVQGIAFRPSYSYIDAPLLSKKCMSTDVLG